MSRPVLYRNGAVYSPADPFATAVLVDGPTVAWIGQEAAAAGLADGRMDVVDLQGALVAPAFVDSRVSVTATGAVLGAVDLAGAGDWPGVAARLGSAGEGTLLATGWQPTALPAEGAGRALDAASGGRDALLLSADGAAGLVGAALAGRLGLSAVPGWEGGGAVSGRALDLARAAVVHDPARRGERQSRALAHFAATGHAAVVEVARPGTEGADDLLHLWDEADGGAAAPAVHAYWSQAAATGAEARDALAALGGRAAGLGGFAAGGPDGLDRDAIAAHLVATTQAGTGSLVAAGADGLGEYLAGLAAAAADLGADRLQRGRHRLDATGPVGGDALPGLLGAGVAVGLRPGGDGGRAGGPGLRLATLLSAGVPVCLGSGSPEGPADPWAAVRACLRLAREEERVSARAAFVAHTRAGYRALGHPDPLAGQLVPGAEATFAVWEASELAVQTPDERVASWSTDARAGTPMLPVLDGPLPRCLRTVRAGSTIHDLLG